MANHQPEVASRSSVTRADARPLFDQLHDWLLVQGLDGRHQPVRAVKALRSIVSNLESRLREVDYIVQNQDSLGPDECAALRAVVFNIPDYRRPQLPSHPLPDTSSQVEPTEQKQ